MKSKIFISLALSLGLIFSTVSVASAATQFTDMPNDWSTIALQDAVDNGLLKGYEDNTIRPNATLTRAEMATMINRAFGSTSKASLAGIVDVSSRDWFADEMAKAIQMNSFAGYQGSVRPLDNITREEVSVVIARVLSLEPNSTATAGYYDAHDVSSWAQDSFSALVKAGYMQGSGNMLYPQRNITRAEFAQILNNTIKEYFNVSGTYTTVPAAGNVMINAPGVTLKDVTINGDLIIGDGVGTGDATITNVKVIGRTIVRGGGENSFHIDGNSVVGTLIIEKLSDGKISIRTSAGATVNFIEIEDNSNDVNVYGPVGDIQVAGSNITVTATNATVGTATITGESSKIIVASTSTVGTLTVSAPKASVEVSGTVTKVETTATATNSTVVAASGGTITTAVVNATGTTISGSGTVTNATVNVSNTTINTVGTKATVAAGVTGTTSNGTTVTAGTTTTTTAPPVTGGGGGGGSTVNTPAISVYQVTSGAIVVTPVAGLYTIPQTANKTNTGIDVTISNTSAVNYTATISIKNSLNAEVSYASASGISSTYIDALSTFGLVSFDDIGNMFDKLGTAHSGWYTLAGGSIVSGDTETAFSDSIDAMFARMSSGETYSVNITLTPVGGSAGSVTFYVKRTII